MFAVGVKNAPEKTTLIGNDELKTRQLIETLSPLNDKRGAKKYIKCQADQPPTLRDEKIAEAARWGGIYGIQCSDKTLNPPT